MLIISPTLSVSLEELEFTAIRAQGAGGQNIHKTSSAAQLRFDIHACSLPAHVKTCLLALSDQRISKDGVIVIKAQQTRSLEQNRAAALERLADLIRQAAHKPKPRRATKPTRSSQRKRVDSKVQRGQIKVLRSKKSDD